MTDRTPDVTIVGAGMAGMTAALHLLEAGFSVKVIEASDAVGGKFGAVHAKHGYHDFAWHVFADWCVNFWSIARNIGLSQERDFVAKPTLTLLRPLERGRSRSRWPRAASISYVGSPEFFLKNLTSGVAHWSDLLLFAYSYYSLLCDHSLEREEFLNRVPVNGYVRSLPFASDIAALLHNELLARIWAIPSYLISVRAYQTYLQLLEPFPYPSSPVYVLKKNVEDGFWTPFRNTLERYPGFTLETGVSLDGIRLNATSDGVEEIIVRSERDRVTRGERVRRLVLAIPPDRVLRVLAAPESRALRERVGGLLDIAELPSQQTSSLSLFLKRRMEICKVGDEPVSLIIDFESMYEDDTLAQRSGIGSKYGLSLLDVSRTWGTDHPTVYTVLASDADALGPLDEEEACRRVLRELQRYVPFTDDDVDWDYTYFQPHTETRLFVNEVGTWENRPEVRVMNSSGQPLRHQIWRRVHNLFLAGDYCRSQIDIVSLEGAAHTGIWAAHAISGLAASAGRAGLPNVAPPRPPGGWGRCRAEMIKAMITPWAGYAEQVSRAVAAEIRATAHPPRRRPHDPSRTLTFGDPSRSSNQGAPPMSDALSTFPGYAGPIPGGKDSKGESQDKYQWFLERYRDYRGRAPLKSGAVVPIPMFFWDARALLLHGTGDADVVDGQVLPNGLRAQRGDDDKAQIQIWAPDYGSTTVGPIKVVFISIQVAPRRTCPPDHKDLQHWWFWWYFGNSVVNQQFKREVWGILNNELAVIEHLYAGPTKTARILDKGQVALRLKFGARPNPQWQIVSADTKIEPIPNETQVDKALVALSNRIAHEKSPSPTVGPAAFVSVSSRTNDDAENLVPLLGAKLHGKAADTTVPFDPALDECYRKDGTALGRLLDTIGFEPRSWDFFLSYNGAVEFFDAKGSGVKPMPPEGSSAETIAADLRKLMRDLGNGPKAG